MLDNNSLDSMEWVPSNDKFEKKYFSVFYELSEVLSIWNPTKISDILKYLWVKKFKILKDRVICISWSDFCKIRSKLKTYSDVLRNTIINTMVHDRVNWVILSWDLENIITDILLRKWKWVKVVKISKVTWVSWLFIMWQCPLSSEKLLVWKMNIREWSSIIILYKHVYDFIENDLLETISANEASASGLL